MPYIKQEDRDKFAQSICDLVNKLDGKPPGEVNYVFSRILWTLFKLKPSYTKANELIGVVECAKQEFIRRQLNAYEDQKIAENGDVEANVET